MENELPDYMACNYCFRPMQKLSERMKGITIVQRTFICSCQGTIRYENVHLVEEKKLVTQ